MTAVVFVQALQQGRRRVALLRIGASLALYLIAVGTVVVLEGGPLLLRTVAVLAVAGVMIRLHRVVRAELAAQALDSGTRHLIVAALGVAGVALLAVWFGGRRSGIGFFGVALVYLAIGIAGQRLRSGAALEPRRAVASFAIPVVATAVGVAAVAIGAVALVMPVVALALIATPFGLTLASAAAADGLGGWGWQRTVGVAVLGAAVMITALAVLALQGLSGPWIALLAAGAVVVMLGVCARSNIDVVVIVAAAAIVWTLADRPVPVPGALQPGRDDAVFVALGDSYQSGEGADRYFDGTNRPGVGTCRRAPTAYPALLTAERRPGIPSRVLFLACSGATSDQIAGGDGSQVASVADRLGPPDDDVRFVIVSAGGNDALFGSIVQACLLPTDCTQLGDAWTAHLVEVGRRLDVAYGAIRRTLPDTPVIVVPYPVPLAEHRCSWSALSTAEHRFVSGFTRALDATVADAAARAGFAVVDTMPDAFAGQRICDGRPSDAAVNFLAANSVLGTMEQSINPTNWVHNSMHPNARGHEVMRATILAWLDAHPEVLEGPPEVGTSAPSAPSESGASLAEATPRGAECGEHVRSTAALQRCSSAWMARAAARFLLTAGALLLPVLLGAWMVALALSVGWRALFDDGT